MAIDNFKTDDIVLSNINQDIIPRQVVMQGEKDGRSLTVQVTNGGIVELQAGLNLNLGWKHRTARDAKGELIQGLDAFKPIDREKGIFRIEYTSSMAQPGTIDAEIQFVTGSSVTKSQPFTISVKPSTVDESAVESESSFTVLQEALATVSNIDEKINNKAEKEELNNTIKQVNDIAVNKVDKDGAGQVGWGMLAQDARENISGDKVAIVGKDSVIEETIVNEAVTEPKIAKEAVSYIKTDFLENDSSENLFDGVYVKGYAATGPDSEGKLTLAESANGRLIKVDVKPDTTYSIRREIPSRLNYATSTKVIDVWQKFDGTINRNQSGTTGESTVPREFSITTGSSDRFLYMSMSVDGKEPFVRIVEGELPQDENWRYSVRPNNKVDVLSRSIYEHDTYSVDKVDFFNRTNMFDGKYIENTVIAGASPFTYNIVNGGRTAEIKVKPNTKYSWGREVPSRMNWGTATKKLVAGSGDYLDGSLKFNMSDQGQTSEPEIYSFITGPNDQYLYINTSNTGTTPFLIVVEGELSEVGVHDYRLAEPAAYLDVVTERKAIELINEYVPPSTERKMRAIYDGNRNLDIYIPSASTNRWVKYNYSKVDSDSINMHQWRVLNTYVVDDTFSVIYELDAQTEWEGAIKEVGASDYMGGTHGDERNTAINFLFDGVENEMTAAFDITVSKEIRIVNHSILNRPDHTDQDLLSRIKVSVWTKDQYTVENRYTCLDAFEIFESKITLMSCRYSDRGKTIIKYGRRDDTFTKTPIGPASVGDLAVGRKDVRLMEFWGDDFYCSAECIADYEKYPNRSQTVANFSDQNRAKMYFDVTGNYQLQKDEELKSKSIYRILI